MSGPNKNLRNSSGKLPPTGLGAMQFDHNIDTDPDWSTIYPRYTVLSCTIYVSAGASETQGCSFTWQFVAALEWPGNFDRPGLDGASRAANPIVLAELETGAASSNKWIQSELIGSWLDMIGYDWRKLLVHLTLWMFHDFWVGRPNSQQAPAALDLAFLGARCSVSSNESTAWHWSFKSLVLQRRMGKSFSFGRFLGRVLRCFKWSLSSSDFLAGARIPWVSSQPSSTWPVVDSCFPSNVTRQAPSPPPETAAATALRRFEVPLWAGAQTQSDRNKAGHSSPFSLRRWILDSLDHWRYLKI